MIEGVDYLLWAFKFHLTKDLDPVDAWHEALGNFAEVYDPGADPRPITTLSRAIEVTLRYIGSQEDDKGEEKGESE